MRADREGRPGAIASIEQMLAPQAPSGADVRLLQVGPSVRPESQSFGGVATLARVGFVLGSLSGEDLLLHQQVAGGAFMQP